MASEVELATGSEDADPEGEPESEEVGAGGRKRGTSGRRVWAGLSLLWLGCTGVTAGPRGERLCAPRPRGPGRGGCLKSARWGWWLC